MIIRLLLPLFITLSLFGAEDSWYSSIDTKFEAGIYLPSSSGTISNIVGESNFESDFGYSNTRASYLALDITLDYDYMPNINMNYFNMQDNKSATLTKTVKVADGTFNSNVATVIDYQVFSLILYQDLKLKGNMTSWFGKSFYSGDLEFDVGLNTKLLKWNYEVQDLTDTTKSPSWIHVNEFIPLPYIGMKYYLYNWIFYADTSALAFSSAKSTSYQIGLDYRVVGGLYLSGAYMYEQFKVVEKQDTVDYKTVGYKVSFKYAF